MGRGFESRRNHERTKKYKESQKDSLYFLVLSPTILHKLDCMQFNLRSSARGQGAYREIAGKYQGESRDNSEWAKQRKNSKR